MSDDTRQSSVPDYDPDTDPDTDATMTAPAEGRPDHKDPSDRTESLGQSDEPSAQSPQNTDAEVLESQEEEQPADE